MNMNRIYQLMQNALDAQPFFTANYGLAERKTDSKTDITQPVYWANGKWNRIQLNKLGATYFRENGSTTTSTDFAGGLTSCDPLITLEKPIKLVALTKRDLLEIEGANAQDALAQELIKVLTLKSGSVARQMKAVSISVAPTSYETNSELVLAGEYANIDLKDFQYYDVVISIDFLISVTVKQSCIDDICA